MTNAVRATPAVAAALLALAGCGGSAGPAAHGPGERSITVDSGETFSLEVPASPALGQNWYLADPRPDSGVVTYRGRREDEDGGDEDLIGSGDGAQFFDFEAAGTGRTTVKLLFCPYGRCHSAADVSASPVPTATAAPDTSDQEAAYYEYTITVR
ncbi:protease inhibitor I42 family protein [Streptomyces sp. cg35]|uniref:protease inhibitor I42 family protein n=1 Tax=Streptomyces sp. cg35 TaxID=3421650 RepID=UPI003D184CC7